MTTFQDQGAYFAGEQGPCARLMNEDRSRVPKVYGFIPTRERFYEVWRFPAASEPAPGALTGPTCSCLTSSIASNDFIRFHNSL